MLAVIRFVFIQCSVKQVWLVCSSDKWVFSIDLV